MVVSEAQGEAGERAARAGADAAGSGPDDLQGRLRLAHRRFPTGVAVVTTAVDGAPYGLAVNAFTSVSMEPPLVLVCVNTTSQSHDHLYAGEHIGISFLAGDQEGLARVFARSGGEKFAELAWHPGGTGVPLIDGAAAQLEVAIEQRQRAGTHTIFIGEVIEALPSERSPLVYFDGRFFEGEILER